MDSNTGIEPARCADRRILWDGISPIERSPQGATVGLTRRAALTVVLLLSLGLWAAIWAAFASLASAALG